jgi:precorrin-3B synthase
VPRTAPDRCPGALRVHEAADGGLVRVRVPGGRLAAPQLAALTAASAAFGDGCLDLTSRGNVQLRGLRAGTAQPLALALTEAGLLPSEEHDVARNLVASPLSALPVAEVDAGLCADPLLATLPGRFLLALADASGDVLALRPDLALAEGSLVIGGRLAGPGAVEDLLAAARAFLAERAEHGSQAWRLSELTDGAAAVARRLGRALGSVAATGVPVPVGPAGDRVVAHVPFGRLHPSHLAALSGADVVLTPWHSVVVPAGTDVSLLVTDPGSPWIGLSACVGTQCASSLADVRADAVPSAVPTHWSGCERRCGKPAGSADVVATTEGYVRDGVLA